MEWVLNYVSIWKEHKYYFNDNRYIILGKSTITDFTYAESLPSLFRSYILTDEQIRIS